MNNCEKTTMPFVTAPELKKKQNTVTEVFRFGLLCLHLNIHQSLEMVSGTSLPW